MQKQPTNDTLKELLQNDSFLRWRLGLSPDDQLWWETYLQHTPQAQAAVDRAIRVVDALRLNDVSLSDEESAEMLRTIQWRIAQKGIKRRCSLYAFVSFSAAAVILLWILFSPSFSSDKSTQHPPVAESADRPVNQHDIQLILSDQRNLTLDKDAYIEYTSDLVTVNGDQVKTGSPHPTDQPTQFNKIIVPHGKRSTLLLEDGTKIWINSGSTVEFPAAFTSHKREIKLVGEIYLEVTKDTARPFFVHAPNLLVSVIGTRLNVSSYLDDSLRQVVLVEGKVDVCAKEETRTLLPNQMASVSNHTLQVSRVNIHDHISWKEGYLHFTSEPLVEILKRLSRYYAKEITCEPCVEHLKFSGKLVLFDDIKSVLQIITHTIPVAFEFKNPNEIFICRDNTSANPKTPPPMK